MKKLIIPFIALVITFVSCQSDEKYESYNRDPKNPSEIQSDFLFNNALFALSYHMTDSNVNFNIFRMVSQYWTQTTYTDESNFDLNGRNIPQNHWSFLYRNVLLDLKSAKEIAQNDPGLSATEKAARTAQAEVLMVYTWQVLVDTFGDIPYTESLDPVTYPLPIYDDASDIYQDLISRINTVIPNLTGSGFAVDNLYYGDMAAWTKFANSLKLKLGTRISDVPELQSMAQSTVESAATGGVFASNDDNAVFIFESSNPNTNPLYVDLVQAGRSDYVVANTVVDFMNTLNDPRRDVFFDSNLGAGNYTGGNYGDNNTFTNFSHIGQFYQDPTLPGVLMDFSEVSFYLADAAARGYAISGSPKTHYSNGITASFDYWGVNNVASYLSNSNVDYDTAPGDWRSKIGKQFWLAMFNRGFEGWTVWRTYDTPTFNLPALTDNPIPTRFTYPVNEQNLNEQNWNAASTSIGGDTQTTKLFWDNF